MQKNPKIILASGLSLALIGGVGTTVYLNSEKGNMAVSDEAADIAEKTVDQPVVDYYDTVCEELSTVTETPQHFLSATEKTIGEKPDKAAHVYADTLNDINDTYATAHKNLEKANNEAPTANRVDGEQTSYKNALNDTLTQLQKAQDTTTQLNKKFTTKNPKPEDTGRAAGDTAQTLSETPRDIMDTMGTITDKAPIYSKATQNAIQHSPNCADFMGGDFSDPDDKDTVVDGLVTWRDTVNRNHNQVNAALSKVNTLSDMQTANAEILHDQAVKTWRNIALAAQAAQHNPANLNPYKEGTPEYRVMCDTIESAHGEKETYQDVEKTARDILGKLTHLDPHDVDGLKTTLQDSGNQIRDMQINEARWYTHATTNAKTPTSATAEKIQDLTKNETDKVDSIANAYKLVRGADNDISAQIDNLSTTLNGLEGMDIDQARNTIINALGGVEQSADGSTHNLDKWTNTEKEGTAAHGYARTVEEPLHRTQEETAALGTWAHETDLQLQNAATGDVQNILTDRMGQLQDLVNNYSRATANFYYNLPYVSSKFNEDISAIRQDLAKVD